MKLRTMIISGILRRQSMRNSDSLIRCYSACRNIYVRRKSNTVEHVSLSSSNFMCVVNHSTNLDLSNCRSYQTLMNRSSLLSQKSNKSVNYSTSMFESPSEPKKYKHLKPDKYTDCHEWAYKTMLNLPAYSDTRLLKSSIESGEHQDAVAQIPKSHLCDTPLDNGNISVQIEGVGNCKNEDTNLSLKTCSELIENLKKFISQCNEGVKTIDSFEFSISLEAMMKLEEDFTSQEIHDILLILCNSNNFDQILGIEIGIRFINKLDEASCARLRKMSEVDAFGIAQLWYELKLLKSVVFPYECLMKYIYEINSMTPESLVQFMFITGLYDKLPVGFSGFKFSKTLEKILDNISLDELAIILLYFSKNEDHVKKLDEDLLSRLFERIQKENLSEISQESCYLLFKVLSRLQNQFNEPSKLYYFMDFTRTHLNSLNLENQVLLLSIGTNQRIINEKVCFDRL